MSQDTGDGTYEGSRSDDTPDDTMAVGEAGAAGGGAGGSDTGASDTGGTDGAAGAELGLTDGGSTFEPEEDEAPGEPVSGA